MTHEEYIQSIRDKIGIVAQEMLEGTKHYLEGVIEITGLYFQAELDSDDKDFNIFNGIASECDHLPLGKFRENWSEEALQRHDLEIQETIEWAKNCSKVECQSLAARFKK